MGQLSTLVQALEWWKQENLSSREPKPHNETLSPKKRNTEAVLLVHSPADQITHVHKVTHKGSTHLPSVNTLRVCNEKQLSSMLSLIPLLTPEA